MYNKLKLLIALTAFTANTAFADQYFKNGKYLKFDLGPVISTKNGGYYNNKTSNSFVYAVTSGYKFDPNNRVEISYSQRNKFKYNGEIVSNLGPELKEHVSSSTKTSSVMLDFYSDIANMEQLTPYFGIGMGVTKINVKAVRHSTAKESSDQPINNSKKHFSWQASIGSILHMHDNIALDFRYKFMHLGKITAPQNSLSGSNGSGHLRTHEFTLGVMYKF